MHEIDGIEGGKEKAGIEYEGVKDTPERFIETTAVLSEIIIS